MTNPQRRLRHGQRPTEPLDWSDTASQSQAVPSELAEYKRVREEFVIAARDVRGMFCVDSAMMNVDALIRAVSHSAATGKVPEGVNAFRKKPVVVGAVQFTEAVRDAHLFDGGPLPEGVTKGGANYHPGRREVYSANFYIETLEGRMEVSVGDWIITGIKGEHYPCKPDIFAATYEPAASPAAPLAGKAETVVREDQGKKAKTAYPSQVRQALTLAMAICDAVPSRAHEAPEDDPLRTIGMLVNYHEADGMHGRAVMHGYAVIRDALESLDRDAEDEASWLPTVEAVAALPEGVRTYVQQLETVVERAASPSAAPALIQAFSDKPGQGSCTHWFDIDPEDYDFFVSEGYNIRKLYTAPLAAAVHAEEASEQKDVSWYLPLFGGHGNTPEQEGMTANDECAWLYKQDEKTILVFLPSTPEYPKGTTILLQPSQFGESAAEGWSKLPNESGLHKWWTARIPAPAEPAPILASALTKERIIEIADQTRTAESRDGDYILPISFAREIEKELARLSKPTAQGTAQSIDTPEFWKAAVDWAGARGTLYDIAARERFVSFIDRHIAAQAPAGRDAILEEAAQFIEMQTGLTDAEMATIGISAKLIRYLKRKGAAPHAAEQTEGRAE